MTDDVIAHIQAILDAHRPKRLHQIEQYQIEQCRSGCTYEKGNWHRHVAEQIVEELGLGISDQR